MYIKQKPVHKNPHKIKTSTQTPVHETLLPDSKLRFIHNTKKLQHQFLAKDRQRLLARGNAVYRLNCFMWIFFASHKPEEILQNAEKNTNQAPTLKFTAISSSTFLTKLIFIIYKYSSPAQTNTNF